MAVPELRVHGVSGTPPRNMLYTDPVPLPKLAGVSDESAKHVRVFRSTKEDDSGVGPEVNAFHWGGLTSGSWLTAFWVLLLPYSLANIAGWTTGKRSKASITAVRVFGLLLTGVFINMLVIASVDFVWQWSGSPRAPGFLRDYPELSVGIVFLTIGWLWWGLVSWASTRSHFESLPGGRRRRLLWNPDPESMMPPTGWGPDRPERWEDPAGTDITDPLLWAAHPILHRLRRIHFGFGYLTLALAAALASNTGWEIPGWALFDVPTGIVLVLWLSSFGLLIATSLKQGPAGSFLQRATALQPAIGAALGILAVASLAVGGVEESRGHWPHLRDTSVVLLFLGMVALAVIWFLAGKISAGAATFGAFFGLVLGAGATFTLDEFLGDAAIRIQGLDWFAAAVLIWLLAGTVVLAWTLNSRVRGDRRELWDAIHETTGDLSNLFVWMPAVALLAAGFAIWQRCGDIGEEGFFSACFQAGQLSNLPPEIGYVAIGLAGLALLITVYLLIRVRRFALAVGLVIGAPLAFWFFRERGITLAGVELSFSSVEAAARTFAIVLPSTLLITRIVNGLKGGAEARRGTGVIWDVAMFWPRWFHPLAPPAYGPHAVDRLGAEMTHRRRPTQGSQDPSPLILAAHSQGTVIALMALASIAKAERDEDREFRLGNPSDLKQLGLLTYGCPVGHLYNTYFPSAGFSSLSAALADGLGLHPDVEPLHGRWANLHRPTDPIGGPLLPSADVLIDDPVSERNQSDPEPKESILALLGFAVRRLFRRGEEPPTRPVYRIHSLYEPTKEFIDQRARIEALLRP